MNIVIVGGGFGGVKTALELAGTNHQITLISNTSYFQYYPALYSTATGHSHRESWVPLKKIFSRQSNIKLVEDTAVSLDKWKKVIKTKSGERYVYDRLVLSLGSVTTYFGIEGLDTYSYGIKSETEIRKLQKHLQKEMSDGTDDEKNYVIIGAGPTGVELAGALGEYIRTLRKKYGIKKKTTRISLIEAAPRVLPRSAEKVSALALARLRSLGVKVELGKKVEKQTADSLMVSGKPLSTQTVIWTSGVTNASFYKENESEFEFTERGKVKVDEFMQSSKDVYVIGDNAGTAYAGLAQTALHDAQFVARHIKGSDKSYKSVLPPSVVPIGAHWAVFEWRGIVFGGRIGSVIRNLADIVGYHDILPIGWAIDTWRAGKKREELPDRLEA